MNGWTFRPLQRADFPLLSRWLQEPHVARWWADDVSLAGIEADYGGCIDGTEPADVFIALLDGVPTGLAQRLAWTAYPQYLEDVRPLLSMPASAWSIDYLIGSPRDTGRGLGTAMLHAFTDLLWRDRPAANAVVVPVHEENVASWRALEKCGYLLVASGDLAPDNPQDSPRHVIYRIDRPAVARSAGCS
ncbi:acetyltransferase [Caenimonas sedimenti]|uniref:Acetyltransferase n=1 Tax=Caenimonas sedimenti TaxID=2596921 RepID=A0A562ZRS6_9BURK|nr:GNAT family N-acetyltransferase [Caenimonas sedimenti]TWO71046.1 acetyltransferase [Caenimonas sedimenti]